MKRSRLRGVRRIRKIWARVSLRGRLPAGIVLLHHPKSLRQLNATQRPGEAAEAVAVAGADHEVVVVVGVFGLGGEAEGPGGFEVNLVGAVEADGRRLGRLALDPYRPLAALRRVVDPGDEVPGDGAAVGGGADASRPVPARLALVVPCGLVVDAMTRDLPALPRHLDRPPDRHPDLLAGPGTGAAAGTGDLDRGHLAEPQRGAEPRPVDLQPRPVHRHLLAAGSERSVVPLLPGLPVEQDPEGLRQRSDLGPSRAQHHLLGEEADVAPTLAQLALLEEGEGGRVHPAKVPGPVEFVLHGETKSTRQ